MYFNILFLHKLYIFYIQAKTFNKKLLFITGINNWNDEEIHIKVNELERRKSFTSYYGFRMQ